MNRIRLLFQVTLFQLALVVGSASFVSANDPHLLNDYALQLLKKKEYEKALEQLQKAFGMFPYDAGLRRNLAEAYMYVGTRQMEGNSFEEAAASFDNAHELFPEEPRYGTMRGIALYSAKNYDAAGVELERVRTMGGETPELLYFLGRVYYDTGNLSDALVMWDKALTLDPANKVIKEQAEKARRESTVEDRMDKGFSSRFSVSHDTETKPDIADSILSSLEDAYNQVGSDLSHFPTARIPVILYTRKDYRTVTTGPEWSGGLYDGKIRLPVGGAGEVSVILKSILFHEYVHVVVNEMTAGNCPTWLNEGLAEVEERKVHSTPLSELPNAVKEKRLLPISKIEGAFTGLSTKEAVLAYEQSYSLVSYMISSYGWYKVRDILLCLGKGLPVGAAMAKVFEDFGINYQKVVEEWQIHLGKLHSK